MSNCRDYAEFFEHYRFLVSQIHRVTQAGRWTVVHCMDVPSSVNAGSGLTDFPGDIIRLHQELGFIFQIRRAIWKEPLGVRLRTMAKGLAHKQIVDDSTLTDCAGADYLLFFRKKGTNENPVAHPTGIHEYCGERVMPAEIQSYKGWTGKQTENRYSHWIWRNYASCFWDDIRIDNILPYEEARDPDDEKHCHPLQLDVIERTVILGSNPNDVVLTPFLGVGSEAYGAVKLGRKAIGIELKPTYWRQAVKNVEQAGKVLSEGELPL